MKTYIFDNEGKTFDRYTIVTGEGEVYGSSFDPFHPQGFGQYCGNVIELAEPKHSQMFRVQVNGLWQYKRSAVIRYKRKFVNEARRNPEWMGKEVTVDQLPDKVKQYVKQLETPEHA